MTQSEIVTAVREVLATESTLTLSTVDAHGAVSSAPLFYVFDQNLQLFWLSSADSRHSRNLAVHSRAAVAVYPAVWHWNELRGVQMEGVASIVEDAAERNWVTGKYVDRFQLHSDLRDAIQQSTLYRLRPVWARYLDNRRGFGFKAETALLDEH